MHQKLFATEQFVNESLTALEEQTLASIINNLYAEPGFSDIDANDISKDTGISTRKLRGVLASLVKKEYIVISPTDGTDVFGRKLTVYEIIYLLESKWHLHPEWHSQNC